MKEEIKNLIEQAEKDFEVAQKNFNIEEYYMSAFLCQQSIEKMLKAFFVIKTRKSAGATHSLIYLAKETGVPKEFFGFWGSESRNLSKKSFELIKWIKNQIDKQ
ncbi:HEPN domain-containing protein [Candidatus Pacearchaeota archaeon]|nr:HEPN domain-containing protein [Candidatus Pacearchaeota archaeon]